MNYYLRKARRLFAAIDLEGQQFATNWRLIAAICAIEMAHRNLVWRLFEYLALFIFPVRVSISRGLSIGKFQVTLQALISATRLGMIREANSCATVDRLLFQNVSVPSWRDLRVDDLIAVARFYNGPSESAYAGALEALLIEEGPHHISLQLSSKVDN